jgi:hypothetical protein
VKLRYSGIHPLVVRCDGVPVTFCGKSRTAYLRVHHAIVWQEKELRETQGASGDRETLDALREALGKFERGELTED